MKVARPGVGMRIWQPEIPTHYLRKFNEEWGSCWMSPDPL